jgi:SAM-dependent methyltransferase
MPKKPKTAGASQWFEPTRCLYCGSDRLDPWIKNIKDRFDYVPGAWSFLRCRACGSAHLSPAPKQEAIIGLYPPVYSFRPDFETNSRLKRILAAVEERTFYVFQNRNEVSTVRRVTGIKSGKVLDVGCGTGDRLTRFARAGYRVRGLDIQPEPVRYVRERLGFEADAGTLETVSYPANSFDIVTIIWVLEHLLDVKSILREIHRILRPGGWIAAGVPFADSFQSRTLGACWATYREAPRHIGVPSREGARRAFVDCGFSDVSIKPDTIISSAGHFALSVIPTATATHAYTRSSLATHLPRLLAAVVTLLYAPMVAVENGVLRRPACGLILARKPETPKRNKVSS